MQAPNVSNLALLAGALLLLVGACSQKRRTPAFLVPVQQEVPADRVTLTGVAPDGTARVTAGEVTAVLDADRRYWARNVPLVRGENLIEVAAFDANGAELRREAMKVIAVGGPDPVQLDLDPPAGPPPFSVRLRAASPLDVVEARFDIDGDGRVEAVPTGLELEHTYSAAGRYAPQVTVRTSGGTWFSSLPATPLSPDPVVLVLPDPTVVGSAAIDAPKRLIVGADGNLIVLSGAEVAMLDADLTPRTRITLRGVDQPTGLAVDRLGRFLTCDASRHRLVRLTRTGALDLTFRFQGWVGGPGSLPLQFQDPSDVVLDDEENIYVADAGNHRLQKLNQEGAFVAEFAVAGEPRRLTYHQGGVHYTLAGSNEVAVVDVLGIERRRFAAAGRGSLSGVAVLPDRSLLATITDGEPGIWLQSFGGRRRRALRLPEVANPQHVALAARADRLELVVLDASGRVLRIDIPEDPTTGTPDQVVTAMLQRLAGGDLEGALALFAAEVRTNYRRQFAALTAEQRAALPSSIQVGAVVEQNEHHAAVAVTADLGGGPQNDVVSLGRDPQTFAWRIQSF